MSTSILIIHSYINNDHVTGFSLVGRVTRLNTLVYKRNTAEYMKVYIKHNREIKSGFVPGLPLHCCIVNLLEWHAASLCVDRPCCLMRKDT